MDYKAVFIGLLIAFLIATALFAPGIGWLTHLNSKYASVNGTSQFDTSLYAGFTPISGNATQMSYDVANSTNTGGLGVSSTQQGFSSARSTFSIIGAMMGFVPGIMQYSANVLGIPQIYVSIATWAFIFAFGITLAYLLFLGVRRLIT